MIALISYGMGNIRSVEKALEKIGAEFFISSNPEELKDATHLILPGVGAFGQGMKNLKDMNFLESLRQEVLVKKKPFLGICLGMQLLFERGEEQGVHDGLGFIKGDVKKFNFFDKNKLKIPHIGWNEVFGEDMIHIPILSGIEQHSNFYFVHSYHAVPLNEEEKNVRFLFTDYGYDFVSVIQKENIFGVQFHPEKSQKKGLKILENFANLKSPFENA